MSLPVVVDVVMRRYALGTPAAAVGGGGTGERGALSEGEAHEGSEHAGGRGVVVVCCRMSRTSSRGRSGKEEEGTGVSARGMAGGSDTTVIVRDSFRSG